MIETPLVHCAHDEMVDVERLVPNPRNPNRHSGEQIRLLAKIIAAQGWRAPITASRRSGFIVRGHARLVAAQELHLDQAPVDWQEYASEAAEWADLLADNRLSELSDMDRPALKDLLEELDCGQIDAELTGFTEDALKELMSEFHVDGAEEDDFDADAEAEKIGEPTAKRGDVWLLGDHRLMCGDSACKEDVGRCYGSVLLGCVLTDPPYGIALDTDYSKITGSRKLKRIMLKEGKRRVVGNRYPPVEGDMLPFDARGLSEAFAEVAEQFWFGANYYRRTLPGSDLVGSWLVWDKRPSAWNDGKASTDDIIGSGFELIWSRKKHQQRMLRHQWSGITARNQEFEREHPTEKPIAVLADILNRWAPPHGIVADPFCGAGTIIIAAEQTGRIAYCMEIAPVYVDVAVKRWENYTGKTAHLAAMETD
ncbi:MAG: DNA methyltransferase [Vicinamibacterales bacterium]|nr:DNA methyltransferase [Vicinamibacterales bacterium]